MIDINRCLEAMKDIQISGSPIGSGRQKMIEEAIKQIIEYPSKALIGEYLGMKNYAGFGDQREDHRYGMGPRHGSIVFSIGRVRGNEKTLGADHVYLLECVRDFGVISEPNQKDGRYINDLNLCNVLREYKQIKNRANFLFSEIEKRSTQIEFQASASK